MDLAIMKWFQEVSTPFFDTFFSLYTRLGDHGEIWIVFIVLAIYFKKTRKAGAMALLALILSHVVISIIIKPMVMRPRPFQDMGISILIPEPSGSSFPSGHASSSFAVATVFYLFKVKGRSVLVLLALLMTLSRVYLQVHYPSDVLIGTIIGITIGYCLFRYHNEIISLYEKGKVKLLRQEH